MCKNIITISFDFFIQDEADLISGEIQGGWYANLTMIICLALGLVLTVFIREDLRRQAVEGRNSSRSSSRETLDEFNNETAQLL